PSRSNGGTLSRSTFSELRWGSSWRTGVDSFILSHEGGGVNWTAVSPQVNDVICTQEDYQEPLPDRLGRTAARIKYISEGLLKDDRIPNPQTWAKCASYELRGHDEIVIAPRLDAPLLIPRNRTSRT
ncbi:hypothetical protein PAXRUDRAFT_836479, partial [Paxillus rubicundulus Ve08.2h10]